MGTHPIFESDFDCLTDKESAKMKLNKDVSGSRRKQRARHFNAPSHVRRKIMSAHSQSARMMRSWSSVVTSRDNKPEKLFRSSVRSLSFMSNACNARRSTEPPSK